MEKNFVYSWRRFSVAVSEEYETLAECIERAYADLSGGDAWPVRIQCNWETLWEQSGPNETTDSLLQFGADNGVILPCAER